MKLSLSLKVTHLSFRHASPYLWNQLPTSLRNSHPNCLSPSQRLSFERAGLTLLHANFLTHANVLIDWPISVSLILCCVYAYIYWFIDWMRVYSVGIQRGVRASDRPCWTGGRSETASRQPDRQHHLLGLHLYDSRSFRTRQAHLHSTDDFPRQYNNYDYV